VAKGAAVLGLALALVMGRCMPAEAARSAGRAGGFSGRSSGMTSRSYSGGSGGFSGGYSRGYSGGYGSSMFYPRSSSTVIVSPPLIGGPVVMAPSPYATGVAVTSASSMLGDAMTFMILLTVGTLAVSSIMNNGLDGNSPGLGGRPTLTKVQVGLVSSARKLKKNLDKIAAAADTSDSEGLQGLLQDVVLALLRNPAYWVYGDVAESKCSSDSELERKFNAASVAERSKFTQETLVNVRSLGKQLVRSGYKPPAGDSSEPDELVVVTLLVATKRPVDLPSKMNNSADMKSCLQALGSLTFDDVMGVELMWTPQAEGDHYTKDECLTEYPDLKLL